MVETTPRTSDAEIAYEQSEHSKIKQVPSLRLSRIDDSGPRIIPIVLTLVRFRNRFAPFVVPRHRRTQMFAVFLWSTLSTLR